MVLRLTLPATQIPVVQRGLDPGQDFGQRALFHRSEIQNDAGYVDVYHGSPITQQTYLWRASFQKTEEDITLETVNAAIAKHLKNVPMQWALAR